MNPEHISDRSFLHAFKEFVRRRGLVSRRDKIVVAESGGIDSMVLLDVLCALQNEWKLDLAVAHVNHQLRGNESEEDEAFVCSVAKERAIPCFVEHADTLGASEEGKRSIQEAARDLRYSFFSKLRESLKFDKIATGHHADDNAETILFNMLRGTGVHGLAGIPAIRKDLSIVRPLLFATRERIRAYAAARGLKYREDSSNAKTDYTRNFLRHNIIPQLREKVNPNLMGTLTRTAELFDQLEQYLDAEVSKIFPHVVLHSSEAEIVLGRAGLLSNPLFLQEYLLRRVAREFSKAEIDFAVVQEMLKVISSETGSSCYVTKDTTLHRDRDRIILTCKPPEPPFLYHVQPNRSYTFSQFRFQSFFQERASFTPDPKVEFIDAGKLTDELVLRSWHDGDWFMPLGSGEKKKVSDFFIEQKIPLNEKQTVPILESHGTILWICGRRLDDRWKITETTQHILKLEYEPLRLSE